jgi:hypothetical protein
MDDFLALYTGTGESQEEMRASGYDTMLRAIYSLNTAVEYRENMDKRFETIDSVTVTDRGRQVQRPITVEEKARHRHRTDVLVKLLKALREAKKPYDEKYDSFVLKPEKPEPPEKPENQFTALENDEGAEDTGPFVPSAPPQRPTKHVTATEEEMDDYMEKCRLEKPSCDNCGRTDVPLFPCSRCKQVKYCSKECQKADWPLHKPDCKSVTESYQVCSFPFYLEKVHTIDVRGKLVVVSTEKEILSFSTKHNRCMGPFHTIKQTPQDIDYIMKVDAFFTDMEKKKELLERGLQAYEIKFAENPTSKQTEDALLICNEIKRRMAGIETKMTELLSSHQRREIIDWKLSKRALIEALLENKKEIERGRDLETLEREKDKLKDELNNIQRMLDISFPVSGLVMVKDKIVVTTKNSVYFVSDRTRIGDEAGYEDGPIEIARLNHPTDMTWLTPTLLCIVDTGNNAIRILNITSARVHTFFERDK